MDGVKLGTFLTYQCDAQHLDAALMFAKSPNEMMATLDNDRNCVACLV